MKKRLQIFKFLPLLTLSFLACEEESADNFQKAGSLKVVHAAAEAPAVHVDYFGFEESVSFSNNPTLSFGANARFTIPEGENRTVNFVNSLDTTSILLSREVTLEVGEISTIYLTGRDTNIEALQVEDDIIAPVLDSITGVRFTNLSPDSGPVTVGISGDTQAVIPALSYQDFSAYTPFSTTVADGSYAFEFRDAGGTVLASFTLNPFQRNNVSVKRNLTLALIGQAENATLSIARINNY